MCMCFISLYCRYMYVCVPVILPCHLSGRPPRPFLWCRAVVCHPDVAAEVWRVQLVPGDFPPEPLAQAGPLGRAITANTCLPILPSIVVYDSLFWDSTSHFQFLLLLHLTCCCLPPSSSLSSTIPNCSWFLTSSVGCSYTCASPDMTNQNVCYGKKKIKWIRK